MSPASHWQRQALLGPARPRDRTRDNQGFLGSYSRTTYAKDEAADVACRWKMVGMLDARNVQLFPLIPFAWGNVVSNALRDSGVGSAIFNSEDPWTLRGQVS